MATDICLRNVRKTTPNTTIDLTEWKARQIGRLIEKWLIREFSIVCEVEIEV